ncbi:killer cell lectin-like receptor subfamily B member 1B allele B [Carettochelys insculpta]|uniref:killer cell lectin-like receptor subfamily B member 1B allele B n=1 Tax=Carettochelys insculpta TaxID=44489 RepID=UPI003EBE4FFF
MASQVTYKDVKILPEKRARIASLTPDPGNAVTYAELRVHRKSEKPSRSETSPSGPGSKCSCWFYVAVVQGLTILVLLAVKITCFWMDYSKSPSKHGTACIENTTVSAETPRSGRCSLTMHRLMEDLCEDKKGGAECLLCRPGWELHSRRCYYFSKQKQNWTASVQNCSGRKSQLLVVEDEAELERIGNKTENNYYWTGLNFREKERRWMWLSDSQLEGNRLRLLIGEEFGKNCTALNKSKLYAESCSAEHNWICKKNATLMAP